jgi:hypothetical protein
MKLEVMSNKEIVWMNESRKRLHEKSLSCLEITREYGNHTYSSWLEEEK